MNQSLRRKRSVVSRRLARSRLDYHRYVYMCIYILPISTVAAVYSPTIAPKSKLSRLERFAKITFRRALRFVFFRFVQFQFIIIYLASIWSLNAELNYAIALYRLTGIQEIIVKYQSTIYYYPL